MSKQYFKVTVQGTYGYVNESGVLSKNGVYREVFELPTMDKPLSIIRNDMLDMRLRHRKKGYKRFRTHEIVNVETVNGNAKDSLKRENLFEYNDLRTLKRFVKMHGLVIKPELLDQEVEDVQQTIADVYALTRKGLVSAGNQMERDLQARSEFSLREELNSIYSIDSAQLEEKKATSKDKMIDLIKSLRMSDESTREVSDSK